MKSYLVGEVMGMIVQKYWVALPLAWIKMALLVSAKQWI